MWYPRSRCANPSPALLRSSASPQQRACQRWSPERSHLLSLSESSPRPTKSIDILVTDCETAASEDVRKSIDAPVTFLLEAQSVTMGEAVSVQTANRSQIAAFVCGNGEDNRRPLVFAWEGQNEAWTNFSKSAWQSMRDVGTPVQVE
jgi:hypothetical protein